MSSGVNLKSFVEMTPPRHFEGAKRRGIQPYSTRFLTFVRNDHPVISSECNEREIQPTYTRFLPIRFTQGRNDSLATSDHRLATKNVNTFKKKHRKY